MLARHSTLYCDGGTKVYSTQFALMNPQCIYMRIKSSWCDAQCMHAPVKWDLQTHCTPTLSAPSSPGPRPAKMRIKVLASDFSNNYHVDLSCI